MGDYPILPVMSKIPVARRRQFFTHHRLQLSEGRTRLFDSSQSELTHREYRRALGLSIRKRIFQNLQSPCYGLREFSLAIVRQRFRAQVKCIWSLAFSASHGSLGKRRY